MSLRMATFNVNNLFVRYRFGRKFPGDMSDKSEVQDPTFGYLPVYDPDFFEVFNEPQRLLAARALSNDFEAIPDLVFLQEVESLIALREFNERYLAGRYPYQVLVDSRDFRQIDVGVLSKRPIVGLRSHVDDLLPGKKQKAKKKNTEGESKYLFSRDCLEVEIALPGNKTLTVFNNHLKSKFAKTPEERTAGDKLRKLQAKAVATLIQERFPDHHFGEALFVVAGDLNDEWSSERLEPLRKLGLENVLERLDEIERWTHWYKYENTVSQLDYLLLSPTLSKLSTGTKPILERRGVGFARYLQDGKTGPKLTRLEQVEDDPNPVELNFQFKRFKEVTPETWASDHCPLLFDLEV
jgi:endonuclease/exonuclease/phosphatase family metal-dependent hydrolase